MRRAGKWVVMMADMMVYLLALTQAGQMVPPTVELLAHETADLLVDKWVEQMVATMVETLACVKDET